VVVASDTAPCRADQERGGTLLRRASSHAIHGAQTSPRSGGSRCVSVSTLTQVERHGDKRHEIEHDYDSDDAGTNPCPPGNVKSGRGRPQGREGSAHGPDDEPIARSAPRVTPLLLRGPVPATSRRHRSDARRLRGLCFHRLASESTPSTLRGKIVEERHGRRALLADRHGTGVNQSPVPRIGDPACRRHQSLVRVIACCQMMFPVAPALGQEPV
jgi:hypothetical protein